MLDDLLKKGVIQLQEPKRPKEVERATNPKYCHHHRMVSYPLKKCITIKGRIMHLAKEGSLCALLFANLKPIILLELALLNRNIQERSFLVTFLDRRTVNMTSCSEVEEEMYEEGGNK